MSHPVWEDHLLERKTDRQSKDIRRTAVAFANSVRPGHVAVILIGEGNDGEVSGVEDPDRFQMKVRKELEQIYPPIVWKQSVYWKDNKPCIRVEIEYSGDTPHFGEAAWVRRGSESVVATNEQLNVLVSLRSGKVRSLSEWQGKCVTLSIHSTGGIVPNWSSRDAVLELVTEHYCTFAVEVLGRRSEPLDWLTISWDVARFRLRIFVDYHYSNV